ncbi:hypothetical protein QCM77_19705 [Bradyrhizobium sp. SSUT18]|uniref:hypothetical protein n=1 Tax=unclassified Bradyrhizobium TaxID=2631580 RepID=UPI00244922AB|nr:MULTISPECIES: hypothetical protein [unclassified Bradyrhizobium]MDH2353246.1 hypothetical protein [Bradyrhizobium sp. SSUT112]MDH2402166.1 hypothetical protein [Bradyrhizobium sp. SSUT18]
MVAAVGIVSVSLDLLGRDEDVFPVLSAPREDPAVDVPYFGRVAIRVVATAQHRIVRHMPARVEFLVQEPILGRMVTMWTILSNLLGRHSRHQRKRQRDCQEELAGTVQLSLLIQNCRTGRIGRQILKPPEIETTIGGRARGAP